MMPAIVQSPLSWCAFLISPFLSHLFCRTLHISKCFIHIFALFAFSAPPPLSLVGSTSNVPFVGSPPLEKASHWLMKKSLTAVHEMKVKVDKKVWRCRSVRVEMESFRETSLLTGEHRSCSSCNHMFSTPRLSQDLRYYSISPSFLCTLCLTNVTLYGNVLLNACASICMSAVHQCAEVCMW